MIIMVMIVVSLHIPIEFEELQKTAEQYSLELPTPPPYYYLSRMSFSSGSETGDVAFMLQSSAAVLFMTIPGLALYYGGMVRTQNILASVMQTLTIACLVTFVW